VDADTMFPIGSTTKMMTAAAVMQLREQGAVDMGAPLPTYLPEYRIGHPWDSADLTLDLLLSHQTGLLDQYFVSHLDMSLMDWV
jgi:CubicO group peptidase (beta-lactamase class C family)